MVEQISNKYAVVDLEATGSSVDAAIIQVGIVIIEDGVIRQTYATDINPHQSLTSHIIDLTGITDQQLAQAPDFSQVAGDIYRLIEDCVFVAHNVTFDANLLAEHLFWEGYELKTPRVDTVELAQVFFPTLEKYSLSRLAKTLGVELEQAHTAIADATATAEIFLLLMEKIKQLPRHTLEQLATLADNLIFESRLLIDRALAETPKIPLSPSYQLVNQLVLKRQPAKAKPRQLSRDFDKNIALLGLQPRFKQQLFADKVYQGLFEDRPSLIQAPSGIGKTLGYLLPLLSQLFQQQLILAVPTKVLQDQLMDQEARLLSQVFHLSCHSIKSPTNYLKLDAFQKSLQRRDDNRLLNRYKMQLLVWLCETETGDLDDIKQKQRLATYFDELRHDGSLDESSPFFEVDFWRLNTLASQRSQLLITNHAYLLEKSSRDHRFLKKKTLVIDEAHRFFSALEEFSRRQLVLTEVSERLGDLLDKASDHLTRRLLESLDFELKQVIHQPSFSEQETQLDARLAKIRQDVMELAMEELSDLAAVLDPDFSLVWLENSSQLILKSSREELASFPALLEADKLYLISASLQLTSQVTVADLLQLPDYHFDLVEESKSKNQHIWVDKQFPDLTNLSESAYEQLIAQRIVSLQALKYPLFVLFTSKKTLFAVSEELEKLNLPHLCQEKSGSSYALKKRFEQGEAEILLATGTFWEGVDFHEQDRMIQVITRLPFDNPKDKLVEKINRDYRHKGYDPFDDYTLPVMTLRLFQALGRGQRRQDQKSALLILDNRLLRRSYGAKVCRLLQDKYDLRQEKSPQILSEIAEFLL
ncbi:bifunctional DnaQ family exonuclease/ATP-dependent helicase [Streptococcus cuniculipharyngis]|uniref:3'-5' exonuclease DinG n=1 Tax=Streptococcus cuniculipharyngis TaxID=1562651 RepID=A0A5C5SDL3_9STRE|nr:bifunctional DnaQ family exonuclease/ATP-dependent helicase [Streptococcus cuniculipharyngis]TWS99046.1 bifunctional DnaQ family exonuclease/ATP-dependent helicase [Streptococcus cuniculipharyngis]